MSEFDAFLAGFSDNAAPAPAQDTAPPASDTPAPEVNTVDSAPTAGQGQQDTPPATEPAPATKPEKTFTQQDVDRIVESRLARVKAAPPPENPILSGFERIAQKSGMTSDQLLQALERQTIEALADQEGLSFEAAERLTKAEQRAAEADRILAEQQTATKRQAAEQADFEAFVAAYPDVAPDAIPAAVWEARRAGKSLVDAYAAHEAGALRERVKALETQLQNTRRAPISGGVGSHGVETPSADPFLQGFLGA